MSASGPHPALAVTGGLAATGTRILPEEVAVALSYDGVTQAVMMASPSDLQDFARGFSLTEGIADPADIAGIETEPRPNGIDLRIWLHPQAAARLAGRRRNMAAPVGCGLCGIESLDQAVRPAVRVTGGPVLTAAEVGQAVAAMPAHQPLHDATRAVHAAAFWRPGQGVILSREDVGRHNALDKLAGAMLAAGTVARDGALVMTSRVSVDLVQKACRLGATILIAVSAPTLAAVRMAEAAGLTVVALARGGRFEVFTHAGRIRVERESDVA